VWAAWESPHSTRRANSPTWFGAGSTLRRATDFDGNCHSARADASQRITSPHGLIQGRMVVFASSACPSLVPPTDRYRTVNGLVNGKRTHPSVGPLTDRLARQKPERGPRPQTRAGLTVSHGCIGLGSTDLRSCRPAPLVAGAQRRADEIGDRVGVNPPDIMMVRYLSKLRRSNRFQQKLPQFRKSIFIDRGAPLNTTQFIQRCRAGSTP
jgi:hypothetical protein